MLAECQDVLTALRHRLEMHDRPGGASLLEDVKYIERSPAAVKRRAVVQSAAGRDVALPGVTVPGALDACWIVEHATLGLGYVAALTEQRRAQLQRKAKSTHAAGMKPELEGLAELSAGAGQSDYPAASICHPEIIARCLLSRAAEDVRWRSAADAKKLEEIAASGLTVALSKLLEDVSGLRSLLLRAISSPSRCNGLRVSACRLLRSVSAQMPSAYTDLWQVLPEGMLPNPFVITLHSASGRIVGMEARDASRLAPGVLAKVGGWTGGAGTISLNADCCACCSGAAVVARKMDEESAMHTVITAETANPIVDWASSRANHTVTHLGVTQDSVIYGAVQLLELCDGLAGLASAREAASAGRARLALRRLSVAGSVDSVAASAAANMTGDGGVFAANGGDADLWNSPIDSGTLQGLLDSVEIDRLL